MQQLGRWLLTGIGGLTVVAGSFFIALKAVDYWSAPARLVRIEEATYGANCAATVRVGNATSQVAKTCDGRRTCFFPISVDELGDAAPGCAKDFVIRFTCDPQQPALRAFIKGEAHGNTIRVSCDD
jgi:hypothetical protein